MMTNRMNLLVLLYTVVCEYSERLIFLFGDKNLTTKEDTDTAAAAVCLLGFSIDGNSFLYHKS